MEWLGRIVTNVLAQWGYLALAGSLLGECAGLPLPGETVLMYASFVAHKSTHLNVLLVILVGSAAAILGDNLGFWMGRHFGARLLRWLNRKFDMEADLATAQKLIKHHGGATIFWARFIFGLRTVAGPVAGSLKMEWKRFFLFNALGGVSWVGTIALTGYFTADTIQSLGQYMEKVSWGVSGGVFIVGYLIWRRQRRQWRQSSNG